MNDVDRLVDRRIKTVSLLVASYFSYKLDF